MRISIPVLKGRLAASFWDFKQVVLLDAERQEIKEKKCLSRPRIQPWMLPHWLQEHDVDLLIAGVMNERAIGFFQKAGIKVVTGAPHLSAEELTQKYLIDQFSVPG
jgi:predicted Fe-Mo cluster-binding NifX family protein